MNAKKSLVDVVSELDYLVRARYPFIAIETFEESRVETAVSTIAFSRNKKFYVWNCNKGLVEKLQNDDERVISDQALKQPPNILQHIDECQQDAIFMVQDFGVFLGKVPKVDRQVKDVVKSLHTTRKTVIFTGTQVKIPPDLEKYVTVVDFPMPDRTVMLENLNKMIDDFDKHPNITVDIDEQGRERLVEAAMGLTISEAKNVFSRAVVQTGKLSVDAVDMVTNEKRQIIRKSGILEFYPAGGTMDDIGGLDNLKEYIHERNNWWTKEAVDYGLSYLKGIVLVGIPGCGKSLTAKVLANFWKLPLLRLDMGKVFDKFVGGSEENIRMALKTAEAVSPCVLWIDEVEKSMSSGNGDNGTSRRVFGQFLTWMQEKDEPVFVACTANDISILPPEFLRKGRFDELFFVDLPTISELEDIVCIHLKKKGRTLKEADVKAIAQECDGYSGAEVEAALESAMWNTFRSGEELTKEVFIEKVKESEPLSVVMKDGLAGLREMAKGRFRYASSQRNEQVKGDANQVLEVEM